MRRVTPLSGSSKVHVSNWAAKRMVGFGWIEFPVHMAPSKQIYHKMLRMSVCEQWPTSAHPRHMCSQLFRQSLFTLTFTLIDLNCEHSDKKRKNINQSNLFIYCNIYFHRPELWTFWKKIIQFHLNFVIRVQGWLVLIGVWFHYLWSLGAIT